MVIVNDDREARIRELTALGKVTDEQARLIVDAGNGDNSAVQRLISTEIILGMERAVAYIFYIRGFSTLHDKKEDACQNALETLVKKLLSGEFKSGVSQFKTYCIGIAINTARNECAALIRSKRFLPKDHDPAIDDPPNEDDVIHDLGAPSALDNLLARELIEILQARLGQILDQVCERNKLCPCITAKIIAAIEEGRWHKAKRYAKTEKELDGRVTLADIAQYCNTTESTVMRWRDKFFSELKKELSFQN